MISHATISGDSPFLAGETNKALIRADIPVSVANEQVRFTERGAVVYEQYALLNVHLYALRDIYGTTVREQPRNQGVIFATILFGSILAVPFSSIWLAGALGVICVSGAIALLLRLAIPSTHVLRITTKAGEQDVLLSRDRGYVMRVFDALNAALSDIQE